MDRLGIDIGSKTIKIALVDGDDGNLVFEGGWQMEHPGSGVHATQVYQKNNGRSYQVESSVPMRAETSVYLTLKGNPEFQEFLNLICRL